MALEVLQANGRVVGRLLRQGQIVEEMITKPNTFPESVLQQQHHGFWENIFIVLRVK